MFLRRFFTKIQQSYWVIFPIFLLVILRVPSLFWGWWYGDENIYLAIASDLNNGEWLYAQTWDNKPPFLYILYASLYTIFGTQAWAFRAFSVLLGAVTVWLFWRIFEELFTNQKKLQKRVTVAFAIVWGLAFEAPLLNAENVFVPLILAGFLSILVYQKKPQILLLLAAGTFWALASLTKIHALVETITLAWVSSILVYSNNLNFKKNTDSFLSLLTKSVRHFILLLLPTLCVFLVTIITFWQAGFLSDLYNGTVGFSSGYVSNSSAVLFGMDLVVVSNLQLRFFITSLAILLLTWVFLKRNISTKSFILLTWLSITIFGSLISDRAYPHYVLQVLPAGFLALSLVILYLKNHTFFTHKVAVILATLLALQIFFVNFPSPIGNLWNYYSIDRYFSIITVPWTKSLHNWQASFDENAYKIQQQNVDTIQSLLPANDSLYIYGDDPILYALSHRRSAANHVTVFNIANQQEWDEVFGQIGEEKPGLVLIQNTREIPKDLQYFLQKYYTQVTETDSYRYFKITPK